MIKVAIFDAGGVLVNPDMNKIWEDIQKTLSISPHQFNEALNLLLPLLTRNEISETEFWNRFMKKTESTDTKLPEQSLFLREYIPSLSLNQEVYKIIYKLKEQGLQVGVLSNSIPPHTEYNKKIGMYTPFDIKIISDEVGLHKPSKEIFQLLLETVNVPANEIVFIDDDQKNIDMASSLGIHSILFIDPANLLKRLHALGISIS